MNIRKERARLDKMTPKELQEEYAELFGEESRSGNRVYLSKRILWRLQANEEGDISARARKRAAELAKGADLRTTMPKSQSQTEPATERVVTRTVALQRDRRIPAPGSEITRQYKGNLIRVLVLEDGFEFEGERYASLSAVAKAVTGAHVNGFAFFNLGAKRKS